MKTMKFFSGILIIFLFIAGIWVLHKKSYEAGRNEQEAAYLVDFFPSLRKQVLIGAEIDFSSVHSEEVKRYCHQVMTENTWLLLAMKSKLEQDENLEAIFYKKLKKDGVVEHFMALFEDIEKFEQMLPLWENPRGSNVEFKHP